MIITPRLIALDTSHYAEVSKDFASNDPQRQNVAKSFIGTIADKGYILVFSFSHLEELFRNENDTIVSGCLSFLASLPLVAWVTAFDKTRSVGSIVDILAFEADSVLRSPNISLLGVRNEVSGRIFQLGSGRELVNPCLDVWPQLRRELLLRNKRTQEIASIYKSGRGNSKVVVLVKLPINTAPTAFLRLQSLEAALAEDIKLRGDRRIKDAAEVASRFFDEVRQNVFSVYQDDIHPLVHILKMSDIDLEEITEKTTIKDIGDIAAFRGKLRVANQNLRASWPDLKKSVTENRIPSGVIQSGLRRFGQEPNRRSGSELGDTYLACLAPYADVTFVDKRTLENFARAARKDPNFKSVMRRVERSGNYDAIPDKLARLNKDQVD